MLYLILSFIVLAVVTPVAGIFTFKETLKRTNDIYRAEDWARKAVYTVGLIPYWVTAVCIFAIPGRTYMLLFGSMYVFAFPFFLLVIPLGLVIYRSFVKDIR